MEYVQGVQLESMIVPGGLPAETLFRYGLQISDALMHAHDRGIVHRDLKAANVIIGTDGRLKVLDFGLAHRLPGYETENATQSFSLLAEPETVAGTLAYIAPETLKTGQSDARSDVWSLGVLFYEMVSGRQPYRGIRGLELVSKVMDDRPVPQLSGRVPGPLRSIIHRCLDKDPALRYQNSREVFTALETAQNAPEWRGPDEDRHRRCSAPRPCHRRRPCLPPVRDTRTGRDDFRGAGSFTSHRSTRRRRPRVQESVW